MTKAEALKMESQLALELRRKRYAVWYNWIEHENLNSDSFPLISVLELVWSNGIPVNIGYNMEKSNLALWMKGVFFNAYSTLGAKF
jgi:hypothetical protein